MVEKSTRLQWVNVYVLVDRKVCSKSGGWCAIIKLPHNYCWWHSQFLGLYWYWHHTCTVVSSWNNICSISFNPVTPLSFGHSECGRVKRNFLVASLKFYAYPDIDGMIKMPFYYDSCKMPQLSDWDSDRGSSLYGQHLSPKILPLKEFNAIKNPLYDKG